MTEILFCFDTEDFTSNYACDAIRDTADLLRSEDIRGCFMTVGLVARQLIEWRRYDILDALKSHEINYHTYGHTLHPNICEYTDTADYGLAEKRLLASECEGLGMVRAAFGVNKIYAAVPPGPSVPYAALYLYAKLGIPVYADSPLHTDDGGDVYFCNALHIEYFKSLEELFYSANGYNIDEFIERLVRRKRAIIYNHPNIILYRQFWDTLNYNGLNKYKFGSWDEPERRTTEEVSHFYDSLRNLIKRLKSDGRFTIRTVGDIVAENAVIPPRKVTRDMLPQLRTALLSKFYYITGPVSLSLSDLFAAVTAFLRGDDSFTAGEAYGFLEAPSGVSEKCFISATDLIKTANELDLSEFLPAKIKVGYIYIGPADYLFAALDFLCGGGDKISITPKTQQCSLDEFPYLRDLTLRGSWMYSPDFHDEYLSDRLRLQAWTIRR